MQPYLADRTESAVRRAVDATRARSTRHAREEYLLFFASHRALDPIAPSTDRRHPRRSTTLNFPLLRTIARDRDFDRAPNPARDHRATHGRTRRLQKHCTYLDLGRLEGGDAADEGGSEESGHCSRVQEWRGARQRGRSRSRASRVIRGKRRVMTQTSSPPRRSPSRSRPRSRSPVSPRGRSVGHAVGRTPDPTSTSTARARAPRHSCTREQCPLSSLPPSSAASPPSRRPRSKCVQCFFSSIDGGRRPSRDASRGTTRTGERARGRYDRRARWSCDGRRGTMRSGRARGDDERKGFGNIVSAHRLLGRVIARDDRREDRRARARARPNDRGWIAIDRGSIDSGGGIGYFV